MALSPLSTGLFSWSHITYTIRELTVTPLEEGHREEEEGREGYIRGLLRLSVARPNNITRDKH